MNETILLVDDEQNILSSLSRLFRRDGYDLITSQSGSEALDVLKEHTPALVISDCRMPEMDGVEFLSRVKKVSPDSVRFMLTGDADIESVKGAINNGEVSKYITKPWVDDELRETVKEALVRYTLVKRNKELVLVTRRQNEELVALNANLEAKVDKKTRMIRDNLFAFVRIVADMIELYDPDIGGHSKRVAILCKGVARVMEFETIDIDLIESAALLHNIGVIGVPRSIIDKNDEDLNADEVAVMKESQQLAAQLIGSIDILQQAGILIRGQSERFNGKGFPAGLKGEEIHIGARILTACKRYDNLRHGGSKDLTREEALVVIDREVCSRLDPTVVKVLKLVLNGHEEDPPVKSLLPLESLEAGMVLAGNIVTIKGKILITCGTILNTELINRVLTFNKIDPIDNNGYVAIV